MTFTNPVFALQAPHTHTRWGLLLLSCLLITLSSSYLLAADTAPGLSGDPALRSASVLILDASGKLVYAKDQQTVRPIASLTKLMTAIVVLESGQDLAEKLTITKADRDLVQLTGSRLEFGARLTRGELLQLALMASENRAAAALGRSYPGGTEAFVVAMNRTAAELGMHSSHFADPAGLMVENTSTAADLALMLAAADNYHQIRQASTTTRKQVYPYERRGPLNYGNTNRLLRNTAWDIEISKTGYINEAGRCLVMKATVDQQELSIVLLNSFGKLTPFGDSNRVRRWLQTNAGHQS